MNKHILSFAIALLLLATSGYAERSDWSMTTYDEENARVREWTEALEIAQENYVSASCAIYNQLLLHTLSGAELTSHEKRALINQASKVHTNVYDSIQNAWTRDYEWTDILFPVGQSDEADAQRNLILDITDSRYQGILDEAEQLCADLSNAILAAIDDNFIIESEREQIADDYLVSLHMIQAKIATNRHDHSIS